MFTADKVVWEFVADTDKLDKAYKDETRNAKKQGDKIGDSFEDGFDGEKRGRALMSGLTAGVKKGASGLKTALKAGTAIAAVGAGLTAGFAVAARAAISSAADMQILADVAGVTAERFQELRYGARQYGIDQDKVADILKDVNDKFGDFNATGAGPLADFFENVAPKVGVLASDFRDLSSDQALGLYVDTLQKAGANQQDMAFYMEALAGDATMLLPLMRDNGKALKEFGLQARNSAGFLSNDAARAAQSADQKFTELGETLRGGLVKEIVELAPQIEDLTQDIIDLVPILVDWAGDIVTGIGDIGAALSNLRKTDIEIMDALPDAGTELLEKDLAGFVARRDEAAARLAKAEDGVFVLKSFRIKGMRRDVEQLNTFVRVTQDSIDEINRRATLSETPNPVDVPVPAPNPNGAFGGGIGGGGAQRIADEAKAAAKAEADALKETQRRIAEAQSLREANLTAEEQYQADLADIREVAADPMLLEIAGGEETIMRARIDALVDLAQASDDVGAAHIALATAIEQGTLTEDAALEAATRLNTEFGLFTKAQIEAREALEKKNDELVAQIEYQRLLAEASGDFTEVTRLTRELEVLRQKGDLLRENLALTEQEAQAKAQADVDRLSKAQDLSGFDDLQSETNDGAGGLENELARIDEIETAKLELLKSYRTAETEALRDFEALKTQIETEAEEERRAIKLAALDDQLAMAEGVFGGISDLLKAAGKEDSKAAKAAAKAEKIIAIGRATVNTAVGVSRALAEQPFPLNFITAGLVGAAGAIQIATIASSFKDGVVALDGPGTERSDDIPAMLSKGESVMTARATRGNELGLTRLNAGMSPEEAFGLGRTRRGYMDGVVAVGAPMARVPDIQTPRGAAFSDMAAGGSAAATVTNKFDITVKDDKAAYAYADRKAKETEAKVPGLVAASDKKRKRARPI